MHRVYLIEKGINRARHHMFKYAGTTNQYPYQVELLKTRRSYGLFWILLNNICELNVMAKICTYVIWTCITDLLGKFI